MRAHPVEHPYQAETGEDAGAEQGNLAEPRGHPQAAIDQHVVVQPAEQQAALSK